MIAAYIEQHSGSRPTVKQHLAALRMLFDWLVTGHVLEINPAGSVRGPKYSAERGKTPVMTPDQARHLFDSIDTSTIVGLRDRALIGVMVYSFARVGAVVAMQVQDYYPDGKRWWFRLHEKGGKRHEVPAHHTAEASNHTFRATGITVYLENGGTLEHAQRIAAHESARTTKLYDRTADTITLDEIEKIAI